MILTGLVAGTLSALLGIGGGIVMLPASQLLLKFSPTAAVATTLFAIVLTSASGALGHYLQGHVKVNYALLIGSGGIIGVLSGSYIFKKYLATNTDIIQFLLALMFLYMAYKMTRELYTNIKSQEINPPAAKVNSPLGLMLLGVFIGLLTGMIGLGGGFIMVPVMIWLFGVEPLEAVGTSLLAMMFIAIVGTIIKLGQGFVNVNAGLIIGLGSIVGAQVGVKISSLINPYILKALFSLVFLYLAISYLLPILF